MNRIHVDSDFHSMSELLEIAQGNCELLFEVEGAAYFAHHETCKLKVDGERKSVYGWIVYDDDNEQEIARFKTLDDMVKACFLPGGKSMEQEYANGHLHPCVYDD